MQVYKAKAFNHRGERRWRREAVRASRRENPCSVGLVGEGPRPTELEGDGRWANLLKAARRSLRRNQTNKAKRTQKARRRSPGGVGEQGLLEPVGAHLSRMGEALQEGKEENRKRGGLTGTGHWDHSEDGREEVSQPEGKGGRQI